MAQQSQKTSWLERFGTTGSNSGGTKGMQDRLRSGGFQSDETRRPGKLPKPKPSKAPKAPAPKQKAKENWAPSQILAIKQALAATTGYSGNVSDPTPDNGFWYNLNQWRRQNGLDQLDMRELTQGDFDQIEANITADWEAKLAADPYYSTDAAHAAFMRESQFGIDQKKANTAHALDRYHRNLEQLAPEFTQQREDFTRGTNDTFEDRGFFRSGQRMDDLSRGLARINRQHYQAAQGIHDQMDDASRGLANYIAEQNFGQAESQTAAANRADQDSYV